MQSFAVQKNKAHTADCVHLGLFKSNLFNHTTDMQLAEKSIYHGVFKNIYEIGAVHVRRVDNIIKI